VPKLPSTDAAMHVVKTLAHALLNISPAALFATLFTARLEEIPQLSNIFSESTIQEPPVPLPRVILANCDILPIVQ
jgi:hypothetical protein